MRNYTSSLCANYEKHIEEKVKFFKNWDLEEVCRFFNLRPDLYESKRELINWIQYEEDQEK